MIAPDKIYLPVVTSMLTKQQDLHHEWQYSPLSFTDENIEYIRKDLILEWANDNLLECKVSNDDADYGRIDAYEKLIDKLNSL